MSEGLMSPSARNDSDVLASAAISGRNRDWLNLWEVRLQGATERLTYFYVARRPRYEGASRIAEEGVLPSPLSPGGNHENESNYKEKQLVPIFGLFGCRVGKCGANRTKV